MLHPVLCLLGFFTPQLLSNRPKRRRPACQSVFQFWLVLACQRAHKERDE